MATLGFNPTYNSDVAHVTINKLVSWSERMRTPTQRSRHAGGPGCFEHPTHRAIHLDPLPPQPHAPTPTYATQGLPPRDETLSALQNTLPFYYKALTKVALPRIDTATRVTPASDTPRQGDRE